MVNKMRNEILSSYDVGGYSDLSMFNLIHCLLLRLSCSDDSEYLLSDLGSRCSGEFGCLIVVGAVPL